MDTDYWVFGTILIYPHDLNLTITDGKFKALGKITFEHDELEHSVVDVSVDEQSWSIELDPYDLAAGDDLDDYDLGDVFPEDSLPILLEQHAKTPGKWCVARHNDQRLVATATRPVFNQLMAKQYVVLVESGVVLDVILP